VGVDVSNASEFTLTIPPTVLERERHRDRQTRGRRETYPVFAGVTLSKAMVADLEQGKPVTAKRQDVRLESALFAADVVDLETAKVLFEANDLVRPTFQSV